MAVDATGKPFAPCQQVAVAAKFFKTDGLHVVIKEVTRVEGEKVYLNNSSQPLRFPERVAIIN